MNRFNISHKYILRDVSNGFNPHFQWRVPKCPRGRAPEPEYSELIRFGYMTENDGSWSLTDKGKKLLAIPDDQFAHSLPAGYAGLTEDPGVPSN